jgi:hypothetical protein
MAIDCFKCKCWIRPFEPPEGCYDCCAGKIIRFAKPFELVEYFGVESRLAEKLFGLTASDKLNRLSDYRPLLTPAEFNSIDLACRNINPKGWIWLQLNLQQRMDAGLEVPVPA